ncbi:tetratricopeptide repeat protein [Chitinophaga japonensis]|uniref:Tetratricopeptide repeat protein n=1 Tax=Chitinophaga japonensis TaxID=104662 RepID=A0A562T6X9_CHIJA|nr:tetratricopeptide repeat protein [Chitinophaga japonensis]TWI89113.1 tetratricopeptide repeat protein [Chitinophaga japonensis]
MSDNFTHNEKLLKIFAGIRCLNKDQLPRYLEGRLTDIEKHLVEQHLVDCDLCYEALQSLQKEGQMEQYQTLSAGIQQYIRDSIKPVSQLQKMERYIRKSKKRESLLIYFWVVAFIAGGGAGLYLMQEYNRNKPVMARPAALPIVPAAAMSTTPPPDSARHQEASLADKSEIPVAAAPRKDTVKAAPPAPQKPAADSIVVTRAAPTPPAPKTEDSVKKPATAANTPKEEKEKDTPATTVAKTQAPPPATPPPAKPATSTAMDTDEFLYKAAMVYQQQGDLNEAISRYKRLTSNTGRVGELARYQLGICYREKKQNGRARRMFKEVVRMDGSMKQAAQQALDNL